MPLCDRHSERGDEPRAFTIGDQLIDFLCWHPLGLSRRDLRACQTGSRRATLQESTPIRFLRVHGSHSFDKKLLEIGVLGPSSGKKYTPVCMAAWGLMNTSVCRRLRTM